MPAMIIGCYQLTTRLGAGGMGEVWRARDTRLARDVAVKILPKDFAESAERLRRFQQEAKTLAALNHPNLLVIHDTGIHDSQPYLVSELLEGETLREALKAGPLPLRKTTDYALQLALGLSAAHAQAIVHRDLKPENIFITADGRVKILDFGLAKAAQAASPDEATLLEQTQAGLVLGTPGYMSPEQVRGAPADPRSDLFSFGVVLFEMLSGRRAFQKETSAETMTAILTEEPADLLELKINVPPGLDRICRRCLEKRPERRFQSASDLAFALESLSGASSTATRAAAARGWGGRGLAGPALAWSIAAASLVLAAVAWWRHPRELSTAAYQLITARKGTICHARFGLDGRTIYYSAKWGGDPLSVFSMSDRARTTTSLVLSNADLLSISSSGDLAVLLNPHPDAWLQNQGTLARMKIGESPRVLLDHVLEADWYPDGETLVVARREGGICRLEEFPSGKVLCQTAGYISYPRVGPGGNLVAFHAHQIPYDNRGWAVITDRSGRTNAFSGEWVAEEGLVWSADGREIWFAGSKKGIDEWELRSLSVSGKDQRLLGLPVMAFPLDLGSDGRALLNRVFSPAETLMGTGDQATNLYLMGASAVHALSPDGTSYLFDFEGSGSGSSYTAYLGRTDGSPALQLGPGQPLSISPDKQTALGLRFDPSELHLLPIGMGQSRRLDLHGLEPLGGEWLADGKHLLVTGRQSPEDKPRVFVCDLVGGVPRPVTPPGIAPDGYKLHPSPKGDKFLAVGPNRAPLICFVDGSPPKPIPGVNGPQVLAGWSEDNESVFLSAQWETWPVELYRVNAATGERSKQPVATLRAPDLAGIRAAPFAHLTPDGKTFVFGFPRYLSDLVLVEGYRR